MTIDQHFFCFLYFYKQLSYYLGTIQTNKFHNKSLIIDEVKNNLKHKKTNPIVSSTLVRVLMWLNPYMYTYK